MITRKKYSTEFKRSIGMEIASSVTSAGEISKREGISATTLYKWRDKYIGDHLEPEEAEYWELRKQIRELEETVSEQALQIHILKKTQKIREQLKRQECSSGTISPQTLESKKVVKR